MIQQQVIIDLVNKATQGTELFLVEAKVTPANKILVFLDSEKGVTIDDCSKISRYIESNLNRDVEDFELNVSSFGLNQPLKLTCRWQIYITAHLMKTRKWLQGLKALSPKKLNVKMNC